MADHQKSEAEHVVEHAPEYERESQRSPKRTDGLHQMQRRMGNRATSLLLQPRLRVGAAGDRHEQQADQMASDVVRRLWEKPVELADGADAERLNANAAQRGAPLPVARTIQAKSQGPIVGLEGGDLDADTDARIRNATGKGNALDPTLRRSMEDGFGADFSNVRVHNDGTSHELNDRIQAKAFTTGNDIFFGSGGYDPTSRSGQELVAHELTHVVQQSGEHIARETKAAPPKKSLADLDAEASKKSLGHAKEDYLFDKSLGKEVTEKDTADNAAAAGETEERMAEQTKAVKSENDFEITPVFTFLYKKNPELAMQQFGLTPAQQATVHARFNEKEKITKPADLLPSDVIAKHLGKFANGAHAFIDPSSTDKIEGSVDSYFKGWGLDSNFVAPLDEANALNAKAHKERGIETIEDELGIPGKYWSKSAWNPGKYLVRWVIPKPKLNIDSEDAGILIEMAAGTESRADAKLWVAGGLTKGGASEAVIKAIPREELIKLLAEGTIKQKKEIYPETADNIV